MNIDIEIYLNNLKNFFNNNPKLQEEFFGPYPFLEKEDFFEGVKNLAIKNFEEQGEPTLSKVQMLEALELAITKNMGKEFHEFTKKGYLEITDKVNKEGQPIFKLTSQSMLKMNIENPPIQETSAGPIFLN
tara:strand:+ start:482 stop:874 length:393 start_codon:yes stop_codon:yes gene_type:complete